MKSNKLTSEPTVEPVTATELDTYLRGDGNLVSAEEDLLNGLIISARMFAESYTRRAFITQSWTLYLDRTPNGLDNLGWWDGVREGSINQKVPDYIELPVGPVQSITSFTTYDMDNSSSIFNSSNYFLDNNRTPGRLVLNTGNSWPVFTRDQNGIEIVYVAGYGDAATDVPFPLKTAIKQLASHWYENREFVKTQSDQNQAPAPLHVTSILNQYKVRKL